MARQYVFIVVHDLVLVLVLGCMCQYRSQVSRFRLESVFVEEAGHRNVVRVSPSILAVATIVLMITAPSPT